MIFLSYTIHFWSLFSILILCITFPWWYSVYHYNAIRSDVDVLLFIFNLKECCNSGQVQFQILTAVDFCLNLQNTLWDNWSPNRLKWQNWKDKKVCTDIVRNLGVISNPSQRVLKLNIHCWKFDLSRGWK